MHNGCSAPSRTPTTSSRSTVVHLLSITHDGTSQTGKMTMSVIAAVAEFERDLLIERTQAGLARARSDGKAFGRPRTLNQLQTLAVQQRLASGTSIASLPKALGTSRQTAMRCSAQMTSYTRGWPRRQQHSMD
ncbi:recombinase family protein [Candidatus Aalborgicola defluviihabitans]